MLINTVVKDITKAANAPVQLPDLVNYTVIWSIMTFSAATHILPYRWTDLWEAVCIPGRIRGNKSDFDPSLKIFPPRGRAYMTNPGWQEDFALFLLTLAQFSFQFDWSYSLLTASPAGPSFPGGPSGPVKPWNISERIRETFYIMLLYILL